MYTLAALPFDRINAVTVAIEGTQKINRIGSQIRLHLLEGLHVTKNELSIERSYPQSPEANRLPRRIVAAAAVGKIDRHVVALLS